MKMSLRRMLAVPAALLAVAIAAPAPSPAAGSNKLPNPGFEDSPTDPSGDVSHQPLLPTGWAFEGSSILFDHSENGKHTGKRMIAISGAYAGKRRQCADNPPAPATCVDNPATEIVEDDAPKYASVAPAWRTLEPVSVTAGTKYTLRVWSSGEAITDGEGARTRIRWLDANGAPIGVSRGPSKSATTAAPTWGWTEIERANITAPDGATGAIILLGYSMDTWIGQIRYDDAYFGTS